MRKIYTYISVLTLAVLALGCSKEVDIQDELPSQAGNDALGETITITLSVPESEDTKTTLGAKTGSTYPVLWSANDVITLNGTAATSFTPASGNASATATFKLANLAAPYNFLYGGVAGHSNQVTFPSTQNYVANGFDPAAMPMYASLASRSDNVTFSHLAALLKFSVTGSNTIDSVTLAAADENMSLSGNFTIGTTSDLLDGSLTPVSGGANLIYSFGGHIQLSDTPFVFYIAVPAGTYEGGITLTIVDNASGSMAVKVLDANDTKTIAAGKVREFNTIAYVPEKEKNLIQIYDATTLNNFRTRVANGETSLNARVTCNAASFSASSIASEWVPIEGYKGIFEGNSKGITGLTKPMFGTLQGVVKNLTLNSSITTTTADEYHWGIFARQVIPSAEVDDIAGLQNCTAEGSITWTPSSAVNSMMTLGGLVGNNRGGTFTGCTNNAAVTFGNNGVSNDNQPSIGGVVGRTQKGGDLSTQGDISNCTNNGTVICAAQFDQNIYIGGVLGYQVEKKETMSGCVNHGLVKVASTASTGQALHLGGVAGMAKGTVENCTNASDGVVTSEACSASTYINQGGVVGRLNNDSGITYETLVNAGTLNVAAVGDTVLTLIGGVVGRCNEGAVITGVTNSGSINYTASNSSSKATYIGGVVASNTKSGVSLEGCNSTGGTLAYSGVTEHGPLYIGGVVGYSTRPVSSCTNAMALNIGGDFSPTSNQYFCYGGIVGKMTGNNISSCLNTGNITYSQQISGSNGYTFVGGVVGQIKGNIADSSNGGTVTITGKNAAQDPFYGGVVGSTDSGSEHSITGKYSSASATNYGAVVINTSVQSNKYVRVGGVAGRVHTNGTMTATNNGPVTITNLTCTQAYIGGLAGLSNGPINSGSANLSGGDITVSALTSNQQTYIGGVAGTTGGLVTADNAGDISVSSGSEIKRTYYLGGIVGRSAANVTSCTNSGVITNAAPMSGTSYTDNGETKYYYMQIGGIVGYNNGSSAISYCHNTGNVSNTGDSGAFLLMGGISSENDGAISNCDNTGDVTNSGNSGTTRYLSIGGISGDVGAAISNCSNGTSNAAGGTISNSGASAQDIQVAGVAAYNKGQAITSCYNKGAVTNSGNTASNRIVAIGGISGWSNDGSSFTGVCYNTGAISNSGAGGYNTLNKKWDAATFCVRMGGLVGCAEDANTIAGTSGSYNYNNGPITESSTSKHVAVGGICGWANSASTDFAYCRNNADGDIFITNNERVNVVVGGILGMAKNASVPVSYTRNAGTIEFNSLSFPSSGANQGIFAGGILGVNTVAGDPTVTITHCYNEGNIQNHTRNWSSQDLLTSYKSIGYSYVGGIAGGGDKGGYKYEYCYSRGDLYIYSNLKMRVGGIAAYSNIAPENCAAYSDVYYFRQYNKASYGQEAGAITTDTGGDMGGIIGYCNTAGPFNNLTFYGGTLISRGSSPAAFGGGILGNAKQGCTFSNCNVAGGTLSGSGSTSTGLFCSSYEADYAFTFSSCVVKSGTKHVGANTVTISSASDLTEVRLFGKNSGTYTGDVTVGSVTNPLANGCPF